MIVNYQVTSPGPVKPEIGDVILHKTTNLYLIILILSTLLDVLVLYHEIPSDYVFLGHLAWLVSPQLFDGSGFKGSVGVVVEVVDGLPKRIAIRNLTLNAVVVLVGFVGEQKLLQAIVMHTIDTALSLLENE